jgi:hypothetical protein
MVPGIVISIDPGRLSSTIIAALMNHGVTIVYESQTAQTEDIKGWLSHVQAEQIGQGARKQARPPWIRQAQSRAPRHLGPKGSRR